MQQQNGSSLTVTANEPLYVDVASASVTQSHVEHHQQFDNTEPFHAANISNQAKDFSHRIQPLMIQIPDDIHISDNSHQPLFNSTNNVPMESHSQQYQLNISNATLMDATVNFNSNNPNQVHQSEQNDVNQTFLTRNYEQPNQMDNDVNPVKDDGIIDSFSSMSISSGPILESEFAVEMCSDFIKLLDNNGGETIVASNNQRCVPHVNEQIMNFCPKEQCIECSKSDTIGNMNENIGTNYQWNHTTPCNTVI